MGWLWFFMMIAAAVWLAKKTGSKTSSSPRSDVQRAAADLVTTNVVDAEKSADRKVAQVATGIADGEQPNQTMFSAPHEVYEAADLNHAFDLVVSELNGPAEVAQRLHAGRDEFLQLLGDTRKAGQWVAQTLDGLDWDWPRWHAYAKTSPYGDATLAALKAEAAGMKLANALNMLTVAQLKALLREHGGQAPSKAAKADVLQAVCALPSAAWEPVARDQVRQWQETKMRACSQKMGARMAGRISHIALERMRLRQRTDPGFLALRSRWEFVCPSDAPRSCKRLNGKVLPAQQALEVFPELPCARLDCVCWIATRR